MAKTYKVDIDKKKADEIKTGWRLGNSDIVQFWRDIEEGAKEAILNKQDKPVEVGKIKFKSVNNFLWCALPSGRNIAYFQPCVGYKTVTCFTHKVADETTGATRENTVVYDAKDHGSLQAFQKTAQSLQSDTFDFQGSTIKFSGTDSKTRRWCPQTTYGGKLVENITQAVSNMERSKDSKRSWKNRQHGGKIYPFKLKPTKQLDTENKWAGEDVEPHYKFGGAKHV
jgi:DNA polymerase